MANQSAHIDAPIEKEVQLSDIVAIQRDIAHVHHDPQTAMDVIAERTQAITRAEGAVVEMLDGDEMLYKAASGSALPFLGFRIAATGSLSGLCIKENKALKCDDIETDDRVDKVSCRKVGVASMIVVPLVRQKKTVGVLKVLSSKNKAFSESHVKTLELIAGVLSAALDDALINEKLRQSEETFRSAMQHAAIGMALVSTKGKWLQVNRALCDMIGYSERELLVTDFQTITHPEDLDTDLAYLLQMLDKKIDTYQMEKRYFHKNGQTIWVLLNVSLVLNSDGAPNYFISQMQDITERKKLEEQQAKLLQKLTESNTELERFAYVASHDLQEPIRMINTFGGMLLADKQALLDEEAKEYLELVTGAGARMREMIQDLLAYCRVGNDTVKFVTLDSGAMLASAIENLQALIEEQKAEIKYDKLPELYGSPMQIMRLFQNLIANAIKYQPEGNIPRIHISLKDQGKHWQIAFKDNGLGIAPQFINEIFEPFRRLHAWDSIKGSGLGLSICRKIAENHGGALTVTSVPEQGSTFFISIPKQQP